MNATNIAAMGAAQNSITNLHRNASLYNGGYSNHREEDKFDVRLSETDIDLTSGEIDAIKSHELIRDSERIDFGYRSTCDGSNTIVIQTTEHYKKALPENCIQRYENNPFFTPYIKTGYSVEKDENGLKLVESFGCCPRRVHDVRSNDETSNNTPS